MKRNQIVFSFVAVFLICMPARLLASDIVNNSVSDNTPDERYIVHENGTVTDKITGFMWQRCQAGMAFDGFSCTDDSAFKLTWKEALEYAANDVYAGYEDWRLPSRQEAFSLVSMNRAKPAFNNEIFPISSSTACWTSSNHFNEFINAWFVNYDTGSSDYNGIVLEQGVWLVRGGY